MFIIESKKKKLKWISGIFQQKEKAQNYFDSIPPEEKQFHTLHDVPIQEYPFYIIEDTEFHFLQKEAVIERIQSIVPQEGDEITYFNLYTITDDFVPYRAGDDKMGILRHTHIDNSDLKGNVDDIFP